MKIQISYKYYFFIFLLFLTLVLHAQEGITVTYHGRQGIPQIVKDLMANQGYSVPEMEFAYSLSIVNGESNYTLDSMLFRSYPEDFNKNLIWDRLVKKYNEKVFTFQRGVFIDGRCYKGDINYISNVVVDKQKRKSILGIDCYYAEYTVGNRIYEVWFTEDLPFTDGPIPLYNLKEVDIPLLPGLILEMNEITEGYSFVAVDIMVGEPRDLSNYSVNCEKTLPIGQYDAIAYRNLMSKIALSLNSNNIVLGQWYSAIKR